MEDALTVFLWFSVWTDQLASKKSNYVFCFIQLKFTLLYWFLEIKRCAFETWTQILLWYYLSKFVPSICLRNSFYNMIKQNLYVGICSIFTITMGLLTLWAELNTKQHIGYNTTLCIFIDVDNFLVIILRLIFFW